MNEYFRFVITENEKQFGRPLGIFQALFSLKDFDLIEEYDWTWYNQIVDWFGDNLVEPDNFSRSQKKYAKPLGICWYKPTAHEYISKMYELVTFLNQYNIEVVILKSDKPGYIVYEDEHQIVAEPFSNKMKRKM